MGVDLTIGAGLVFMGVVVRNSSGFEQGTVLMVGKFLAMLDLELLRLGLDNLKSRLVFDCALNHSTELVVMEVVGLGYHGVVPSYLVLPVEEVPVGGTAPMAVINAGGGNVSEKLARVKAGSCGFQGVVAELGVDLLSVGVDFLSTDNFLALVSKKDLVEYSKHENFLLLE